MNKGNVKKLKPFNQSDYEFFKECNEDSSYLEKLDGLLFEIEFMKTVLSECVGKSRIDPIAIKYIARLQRNRIRDIKHHLKYMESNLIEIESTGVWK